MSASSSSLRDQAAAAVLVRESGLKVATPEQLVNALPGSDLDPQTLDTQEQAWLAAAGATLRATLPPATVSIAGAEPVTAASVSRPITGAVTLRNAGSRPVWWSVSVSGVPKTAPPASRHLMQVHRYFFGLDGKPVDPGKLPQNSVFVMVVEGAAEDGQAHQAMLMAGLPAGWEIAGRFGAGAVPGLDWLGKLSPTRAQQAADDRFAAAIDLAPEQQAFRVAVMLRAVTPGNYEYPGVELADMYRPALYARQQAVRVDVLPPQP